MSQNLSLKRSYFLSVPARLGLVLVLGLGLTLAVTLFALTGRAAPGSPALDPPRNSHTAAIAANGVGDVRVTAGAPGDVLINEIVTDPQQDWSANDFDGVPGTGTVSQGVDEWVELYVITAALDLTGWTIVLSDTSPVTGDLTSDGAFQVSNYIAAGGGSFTNTAAGDYLVLGSVAGSGQMNNAIWVILKDDTGAVVDQVELGDDPQGDGNGDGAPDGSGNGGNAMGIFDEAIARLPNGADTDNDVSDFCQQIATLGVSNNTADLVITKTVAPNVAVPGEPITYTLAFSNSGTLTATHVVITDIVPVGQVGNLSYTVSSGVTITRSPGITYEWTVQDLALGEGGVITITGVLSTGLPAAYTFTNTAVITTTAVDADPANNSDTASVTVIHRADLAIIKTVIPDTASPSDTITYTLAFSNSGTLTATQVVITDIVPVSVTVSSVISSGVPITDTGASPPYVWNVQDLAPGDGGVITITGVLSTGLPPAYTFTNTATITTSGVDCDPTNNTSAVTVTTTFNDLVITKTASPEPVVAGTSLFYTITIANEGLATFADIVLSDTLHPSTTLQYVDQIDNTAEEFNAGTHWNTHWYDPPRPGVYGDERLELLDTITPTGVFTSGVMDASNVVAWTTLSWAPRRPYWKPLPDNGGTEVYYDLGEADMTGNQLLLHLDERDEISPTTVFSDTSGQGNDGICPAIAGESCPTAGAGGRFNGALSFDGALSQTVVISDAADPLRYAIELWVYPTVVTDTSFILRTDTPTDTAENYSYLLGIEDGRFRHAVNSGQYSIVGTTVVTVNTWYHVVGTAESGGDIKLYVNGAREARLNRIGALWTGGDWYRLGSTYGPTGTSQYFSGRLDEAAVYSRTLSSGEVNDHYLRGALRLSFQARSCNDALCEGESFGAETYSEQSNTSTGLPSVALSGVPNNRYFQYRVTLETDNPDYSPELESVTVGPLHRAVIASQGSCIAPGASGFTCTLGSLASGGVITVTTEVDVHPSALGIITNTVSLTSTSPDADPSNNTAFVTSTVVSEVDLNIAKYDSSDRVNPGSPMTYTLVVHNAGPSTAWNVTVTDTLPIAVTGVSAPDGWDCGDSAGNNIVCTTPSLLRYTWPDIIITGDAPLVTGTITNTGWITASASYVYTTSNISDTETTLITPLADLVISKSGSPDPVDPEGTVTYTIVVTNTGPSAATNVEVTDILETAGLVNYPVDNSDWTCSDPSEVVVCTLLSDLEPMESASFQITVTAPLSGLIANYAVVEANQFDPDLDNNIAYAFVAVLPVADLHINKEDVLDPVDAATPLTYTLTVTNTGYVPAGAFTTTQDFINDHGIPIRPLGRAQRYPSNLHVGGVTGFIENLTVRLHNLSHDYPADLSILLVGPDRQTSVVLMSNAGGGVDAEDVTLTFNDAGVSMPINDALTSTVVYRPTNYGIGAEFPPPAPSGPYGGSLSALNGASPNGLWRLYVMDTVAAIGGEIAGGWSLHFTTTTMDTVTLIDTLPAGLTGVSMAAPYGWACGGALDTWTCTADYLGVNVPTVFTIMATAPITGGVITNTATITSTTADFWPESNTDTITTTIISVADLGITKQVAPTDVVEPRAPLTYTLTISNAGPSPVQTAVVTDVLPAGLTGVSAPGCDISALPLLTCTLNNIAVDAVTDVVITADAPGASGVITNTAGVTATARDPDMLDNSAFVTVTVMRQPIAGLSATNDSPTVVGDATFFTASVTAGSDVIYHWAFGDGSTGSGDQISHTYEVTGNYTAVVTASNSANSMTATTQVSIIPPPPSYIYLPLVMRNYVVAPDLVVDSIVVASDAVTVTISNQGDAPVTAKFVNEFWVDVYIDPDTIPTRVNQTWEMVGDQGLVWGVTKDALPLGPGDTLTLTMDDDYYQPGESQITGTIPITAPIWAQVDSAHKETDYGAVLENHEITGGAYNNISGPVYPSVETWEGSPEADVGVGRRLPQTPRKLYVSLLRDRRCAR